MSCRRSHSRKAEGDHLWGKGPSTEAGAERKCFRKILLIHATAESTVHQPSKFFKAGSRSRKEETEYQWRKLGVADPQPN